MNVLKSPLIGIPIICALLIGVPVIAQMSGSRGGVGSQASQGPALATLGPLSAEVAQSVVTIDGKVELRVEPTEIRIVLALTSEAETSSACKQLITQQIAKLKPGWIGMGIPEENIVEDFISVLPCYEYEIKSLQGQEVAAEKKVGYLLQNNIHLAVKNDAEAMRALDVAFEHGVTDIIGFDYWSKDLDQKKNEARLQAIKIAKEKSQVMLDGLFDKRPPIINIQERTDVYYPESMYVSFDNTASAEYRTNYYSRRNLPEIRLYRPKNTYYRGLDPKTDVQSNVLPMKPEISVVANVRLYFESPTAKAYRESQRDD